MSSNSPGRRGGGAPGHGRTVRWPATGVRTARGGRRHREDEGEDRALARPRPDADLAAVRLDEALHDGEAEAGAAVLAGGRAVHLVEDVEDALEVLVGDADAGVGHVERDPARRLEPRRSTVIVPPAGRELHRVRAEVHEALAELVAVRTGSAGSSAGSQATLSPFFRASGSTVATASRITCAGVDLGEHEPHAPGLDLGDVEDRGDELEEVLPLLHDDAEVLALLGGERPAQPLEHHLGVADDARERRAELVAHRGEEVRLQPVELLQLGEALLELPVLLLQLAVALRAPPRCGASRR